MLEMMAALAGIYLALCGAMYALQDRLLFLPEVPGRTLDATPAAADLAFEDVTLTAADGVRLHGWWVPAEGARWTLLHLHGNAGNIGHRLELLRLLHDLGANVLLFDYRGYGRSEGKPSEDGLQQDAAAAWRWLTQDRGIAPGAIVVHGQSMGGPFAAGLAAREQPAALVLESTFTSVPDMAAQLYPWLPARRLARLRLDTRAALAGVRCPVLVIHSRGDEIIPYAQGEALFAAAPEPKTLVTIGGSHNDGFWVSREAYLTGFRQLLAAVGRTPK
jgi:fermentation-respiration switch protein FrsA (DUF1100 family)